MGLHRLVSVTLGVPDVDAARAFYADFGLTETTPGRFATVYGGEELRLIAAPYRTMTELAVGAASAADLHDAATRLERQGIAAARDGADLVVRDPASRLRLRAVVAPPLAIPREPATPMNGPGRTDRHGRAPVLAASAPVRPRKLGHVVWTSPDPGATLRLLVDGLGFKVSDHIGDQAWFLRCSTDHHNLFLRGAPLAFVHHTAWEVADVDEIGRGAQALLAGDPSRHVWGLGRHHIGSNLFWYFRDPADTFAEYYADIDVIPDDAAWTAEDFDDAKGLFSWGPPPPSSFVLPEDLPALMAAQATA